MLVCVCVLCSHRTRKWFTFILDHFTHTYIHVKINAFHDMTRINIWKVGYNKGAFLFFRSWSNMSLCYIGVFHTFCMVRRKMCVCVCVFLFAYKGAAATFLWSFRVFKKKWIYRSVVPIFIMIIIKKKLFVWRYIFKSPLKHIKRYGYLGYMCVKSWWLLQFFVGHVCLTLLPVWCRKCFCIWFKDFDFFCKRWENLSRI